MSTIEHLRDAWESSRDDVAGHAYGEALEDLGRIEEAAEVYRALISEEYLIGYADLAWLEHRRGELDAADRLLEEYLRIDEEADEMTAIVSGLLGSWRWDRFSTAEAEPLLRAGADVDPVARVDLSELLVASGRTEEAEQVLREGTIRAEVASFLPLANLLSDAGRPAEAELTYRAGFALGDAHCAYNLSVDLARRGRVDEADEWLRLAAAAGDEKSRAWLERADE